MYANKCYEFSFCTHLFSRFFTSIRFTYVAGLETSLETKRDSAHIPSEDCFLFSVGVGLAGEQEDEEAFLEGITSPSGPPLPQLALKVKLHTADHWSPALLIKPGQHQAGQQQQGLQGCLPVCMLQWLIC